jgi:hypothetical protein
MSKKAVPRNKLIRRIDRAKWALTSAAACVVAAAALGAAYLEAGGPVPATTGYVDDRVGPVLYLANQTRAEQLRAAIEQNHQTLDRLEVEGDRDPEIRGRARGLRESIAKQRDELCLRERTECQPGQWERIDGR